MSLLLRSTLVLYECNEIPFRRTFPFLIGHEKKSFEEKNEKTFFHVVAVNNFFLFSRRGLEEKKGKLKFKHSFKTSRGSIISQHNPRKKTFFLHI